LSQLKIGQNLSAFVMCFSCVSSYKILIINQFLFCIQWSRYLDYIYEISFFIFIQPSRYLDYLD